MKKRLLFIDGSVDPKSNIGFGAYLFTDEENLPLNDLQVNTIRFENTSSSKLELEILLYALNSLESSNQKMIVYSDSNSIISLVKRKTALIKNNFRSKNGRLLNQHLLYQEFYDLMTQFDIEFIQLKGHLKSSQKERSDRLFTLVDRASRKALRSFLSKN